MNWKQIIIIVLFMMGMLTACTRQEEISLEASTTEDSSSEEMIISSEEMKLYVYVCGHVKEPGVYKLDEGARVCDALESAGGTLEDARAEALDQAVMVTDGQTMCRASGSHRMRRQILWKMTAGSILIRQVPNSL